MARLGWLLSPANDAGESGRATARLPGNRRQNGRTMVDGSGRYLIPCLLCAGLVACEGGGQFNPGAPAPPAPGGYYTGNLLRDGSSNGVPVTLVVSENGRMLAFSDDTSRAYFGRLESSGEAFSGSYRAFSMFGSRGLSADTGEMSGISEPRQSLEGRFTEAAGLSGTLSLDYETAGYESIFPLATLAGDWTGPGDYQITLSERGELSGESDFGCGYTGRLTLIDARYSPYKLQLTETCGTTVRSMTGIALPLFFLLPTGGLLEGGETFLILAAADAEEARLIGLSR